MTPTEVGVVLGGLALIALINWYFFFSEGESALAAVGSGDVAEVPIVVQGGYSPSTVRVPAGARVRLVFDRREDSSCSEEVVIPAFGIRKFLPAHDRRVVELPTVAPGKYGFTCGMNMLRGTLVVEARS